MRFADRALDVIVAAAAAQTPAADGIATLSAALKAVPDVELADAAVDLLALAAFFDTELKQKEAARFLLEVFQADLPRMQRLAFVDGQLRGAVDDAARLSKSLGSESAKIPVGARGPAPAGATKGGLLARFQLSRRRRRSSRSTGRSRSIRRPFGRRRRRRCHRRPRVRTRARGA